jgi:hypothetical protein
MGQKEGLSVRMTVFMKMTFCAGFACRSVLLTRLFSLGL